jgi:hypothetical protein
MHLFPLYLDEERATVTQAMLPDPAGDGQQRCSDKEETS